ncbi:MAG TPA: hypothetical protein VEL75_13110 [Candidatus Methylomirabilis sp.]|nr:hypothetical protein [Candidatus Methylomirabilis sp.]
MRHLWRYSLVGGTALIALLVPALPARAEEYRLQVVSIYQTTYASFLRPGELSDGASGPGLDGLETTLDRGGVPAGAVLFDRRAQPVRESIARAYGGARIVPQVKPGGDGIGSVAWDEFTWEGKPGERTVWVVTPIIRNIQELFNAALKGTGPLRNYQPFTFPVNGTRATAVAMPLNFVWAQAERGVIWDKYLSRSLDLKEGIGAVVGVNTNPAFPDEVYLVVTNAEKAMTYKAVLIWRERAVERQAPGGGGQPMIVR